MFPPTATWQRGALMRLAGGPCEGAEGRWLVQSPALHRGQRPSLSGGSSRSGRPQKGETWSGLGSRAREHHRPQDPGSQSTHTQIAKSTSDLVMSTARSHEVDDVTSSLCAVFGVITPWLC